MLYARTTTTTETARKMVWRCPCAPVGGRRRDADAVPVPVADVNVDVVATVARRVYFGRSARSPAERNYSNLN